MGWLLKVFGDLRKAIPLHRNLRTYSIGPIAHQVHTKRQIQENLQWHFKRRKPLLSDNDPNIHTHTS